MVMRKQEIAKLVEQHPTWIELLADVLADTLELSYEAPPGFAESKVHSVEPQVGQRKRYVGVLRGLLHDMLIRFSSNNRKLINQLHAGQETGDTRAVRAAVVNAVLTRGNHTLLRSQSV